MTFSDIEGEKVQEGENISYVIYEQALMHLFAKEETGEIEKD